MQFSESTTIWLFGTVLLHLVAFSLGHQIMIVIHGKLHIAEFKLLVCTSIVDELKN